MDCDDRSLDLASSLLDASGAVGVSIGAAATAAVTRLACTTGADVYSFPTRLTCVVRSEFPTIRLPSEQKQSLCNDRPCSLCDPN
jgi:hypothetical protein